MAYQKEIDNVKTKLRGLWSQYGNSGGIWTTGTANLTGEGGESPIEEVLLFPTYAYRDEVAKVWRVQVRGWAFCRNPGAKRVRLATTAMRKLIGIPRGGESDQMLLERVSHLLAGVPTSADMVQTALSGISEPEAFELKKTTHDKVLLSKAPPKPPRRTTTFASVTTNDTDKQQAVNLMDAPIVLTSQFDPASAPQNAAGTKGEAAAPAASNSGASSDAHHKHDRLLTENWQLPDIEPTLIQKALQIDALSWQTLNLQEGLFQGEMTVGYNELEFLMYSYKTSHRSEDKETDKYRRRLVRLRGKLFNWPDGKQVEGVAHLVEPEGISIISDIDDTIKASNITADKRIVLETVFAKPLKAVPGMAELYREWYRLGAEFHYVSNSPWQLYPALDDFFHENKFPPGSAHLRSFDPNGLLSISNFTGTPQMKRDTIELLFSVFPNRKYVLVGDCGEHDLETYTDLARRFPSRVIRIYIRDLFAPMSVASVTTDTDVAGNQANAGVIPYGVVQPSKEHVGYQQQQLLHASSAGPVRGLSNITDTTDLIQLGAAGASDSDYASDASNKSSNRTTRAGALAHPQQPPPPPPVPPKPSHLRQAPTSPSSLAPSSSGSSTVPPPKPPRTSLSIAQKTSATPRPPLPPRRTFDQQHMPGSWNAGPANAVPGTISATSTGYANDDVAASISYIDHMREQAQAWMAFYAQKFYVAPTHSFIRYASVFMPTVEANPHIIKYESISSEVIEASAAEHSGSIGQPQTVPGAPNNGSTTPASSRDGSQPPHTGSDGTLSRSSSFASFNIPEPPPKEAQLVRNNRRLLLWKRYLDATRDLPPDLCRLFVDASDIKQDLELFSSLFPKYASSQL
ncbi:hypothetical protein GGI12_002324 [Dipsacomyces acuminosporus]|nr:hypothetical protein GGI12_002324 [Dipsacomyces acuminosporus]